MNRDNYQYVLQVREMRRNAREKDNIGVRKRGKESLLITMHCIVYICRSWYS